MGKICWLIWWPRCKFIYCLELIYHIQWHNIFCAHTHRAGSLAGLHLYSISYLWVDQSSIGTWSSERAVWSSTARAHSSGAGAAGQSRVMAPGSAYGTGQLQRESPSVCTAALPARAAGGRIQPGCGWRCAPTAGGHLKTWTSFTWTREFLLFWILSGLRFKQLVKISAVKALSVSCNLQVQGRVMKSVQTPALCRLITVI